ncbi:4-hydroxythreonine-4-phosphate dehydrogenase [Vibrio variabilis]|uniref:4-hydroxythreonine-4-phosphate dehydrogenase n=1 Tax=Vibrio variabilis TaxID=990271 RepID=A0ABQ0JC43_9VIBR|nr:4-hydroxythreonine-4-phosphate dehydrogenase [Vibrio variabilis]
MQPIKRVIVTAGEPAGIGPDLAVALSQKEWPHQVVICADKSLIAERAQQLGISVEFTDFDPQNFDSHTPGRLVILHEPLAVPAKAGVLDERNGQYVLNTLEKAAKGCMKGEFDAIVTGLCTKGDQSRRR